MARCVALRAPLILTFLASAAFHIRDPAPLKAVLRNEFHVEGTWQGVVIGEAAVLVLLL